MNTMTKIASLMLTGVLAPIACGSTDSAEVDTPDTEATASTEADDESTPIEAAAEECGSGMSWALVADEGASISIDTEGEEHSSRWTYADVDCVLDELGAPPYVDERIGSTRALDGTLDAEWSDFTAFWTYHPDDGLNITVYAN